jgi:hypothetical protein
VSTLTEEEQRVIDNSVREAELRRIDSVVDRATRRVPDDVAENLQLEQDTGLPYQVIEQDKSEARRQARLRAIDTVNLNARSPKTATWLSNERNASIASDDIEVLEQLEHKVGELGSRRGYWDNQARGFANTMSKIGTEGAAGYAWVYEQLSKPVTRLIDTYSEFFTGEEVGAEQLAQGLEETARKWLQERDRSSELFYDYENRANIDEVIESPTPGNIADFIAEAGPSQIPYMIAAGISYPLIVSVVANQVAEERVNNDNRDGLPTDKDMYIGGATAAVSGLLERYALGKLLPGMTPKKVKGFAPFGFKEVAAGGAREAGTEFIQESLEAFGSMVDTEKGVDVNEIFKQGLAGSLVGAGMGAGLRTATVYPDYTRMIFDQSVRESFNQMESEEGQVWIDDYVSLAQSSATGGRASDAFQNFISGLDPETQIYLSSDIAAELEGAPQYVVDQLDGTGADVAMSLEQFSTDFALNEERLNFVRNHIKVRAHHLTQSQIEEREVTADTVQELVSRAEKSQAAKTEADLIFEQVKGQLASTRRMGEHTSSLAAELIPAYVVTKHEELKARGIDRSVKQIYEDMGLSIIGPGQKPNVAEEDVQVVEEGGGVEPVAQTSATQDFGDIEIVDYDTDEAGNQVEIRVKAQDKWDYNRKRLDMLERLRKCLKN